jgi:carbamoyltransferase
LCFAGGVSLNSVAMGKILDRFSNRVDKIYVTPTPHDGGLTLGAAQYVWHHVLDNPRIKWEDNYTPYLGFTYNRDQITAALDKNTDKVKHHECSIDKVVDLLDEQNIVAVFGGGSESGRRALGNRSILADPRSPDMKDKINFKVKHRQWFRPFAPSILREHVPEWFTKDIDSPYMSFVVDFRDEVKEKVPAVVHLNGSARLQTVTKSDNEKYYDLLSRWNEKSGVPILLNTSFNDREPICETPEHAINCYLKTEIDYLYFYDEEILVSRK